MAKMLRTTSIDLESRCSLNFSDASSNIEGIGANEAATQEKITCVDKRLQDRKTIMVALTIAVGACVSGAFIGLGVRGLNNDQDLRFQQQASEVSSAVATTFSDYQLAGLWIHQACRSQGGKAKSLDEVSGCSRKEFRELYDYVVAGDVKFQSMAYSPNVTEEFRAGLEMEASEYYREQHPELMYFGITGLEFDENATRGYSYGPRSMNPFYFPQHFIEPVISNEFVIDFDVNSALVIVDNVLSRVKYVEEAVTNWKPVISNPILTEDGNDRYVFLLHPGIQTSASSLKENSPGLSALTITFSQFIERILAGQSEPISLYIFDSTSSKYRYFGGVHIHANPGSDENRHTITNEVDIETLRKSSSRIFQTEIPAAQQTWTVVVAAQEGTFEPQLKYVILGGCLLFAAVICFALWLRSLMRREASIAEVKQAAEAEKAALIVENAKRAAQAERELNDFIAHEVRNPLTAAMSACSFLSSTSQERCVSVGTCNKSFQTVQEDINVITTSLEFIDDLLRSMLDIHRAANREMKLEKTHTDILKDVLEPIQAILRRRTSDFEVIINCPKNVVLMADRMRLKQILLNLASNSVKFVQRGYVRLRVCTHVNSVEFFVEDSGPGIPMEKRSKLFSRFQESLDSLNQGTGIGLFLCKSLVTLMDGDIRLDDSFESGIKGCPGTRFVVTLNCAPLEFGPTDLDDFEENILVSNGNSHSSNGAPAAALLNIKNETSDKAPVEQQELPENFSVLIVDDDMVLRKLLRRSIKRIAPAWSVQEAANGETALSACDDCKFDLIFLDQYMASIEKQLLGTETAYALRAKGVTSIICGLSANNLEDSFVESGADAFMLKPFPCQKEALKVEVLRVLQKKNLADRIEEDKEIM